MYQLFLVGKTSSYSFWFVLLLFFFVVLIFLLQKWAADQALQIVNRDFKADMSTESVEVNFLEMLRLKV
jgi:hypothetical protein